MRRLVISTALVFGFLGSALAGAPGPSLNLTDSGKTVSFNCNMRNTANVTGNNNKVTLTGQCVTVNITGTGNTVGIASALVINATGSGNYITWKTGSDATHPPTINNTGGNKISKN